MRSIGITAVAVGAGLAVLGMLGVTDRAAAQASRCADCHFANPETAPAPDHLYEWDRSPHRRNGIGCESCHAGDATTFESLQAHRGVLSRGNPTSPVNRVNIPRTCGSCHPGPYTNFQQSQHFALLNEGNRRVPVCVTCQTPRGL